MLDLMRPMYALYVGGMGARARTSTTTSPASTATRRRPRRSRTSTSAATSATPRRRCRSSGSRRATWSAPRRTSRSGSRPSARPGSPTCRSRRPPRTPPPRSPRSRMGVLSTPAHTRQHPRRPRLGLHSRGAVDLHEIRASTRPGPEPDRLADQPPRVPVGLHPGHRIALPDYGVPSIARLLDRTREFEDDGVKRYDDTLLFAEEATSRGSTRRAPGPACASRIHGHYAIPDDEPRPGHHDRRPGPLDRRVRLAPAGPGRGPGARELHDPVRHDDGHQGPPHDVRRLPRSCSRRTNASTSPSTRPTGASPRPRCGSPAARRPSR